MYLPTASDYIITWNIVLSGLLAGVIGWQRHHVGRPAGIRTHALVAMASASFTLAGIYGFGGPHVGVDPTRIAAQIVSGIGFLGAGTIFRAEHSVFGLTTAATLWYCAAVGVLIGGGLPWVAILLTVLAFLLLTVVGQLENRGRLAGHGTASGADRGLQG